MHPLFRTSEINKYDPLKQEGSIEPDSKEALEFGFTSALFFGYLWRKQNEIWISMIISRRKGRGHFSQLLKKIEELGFDTVVPTPFPFMREILLKKGFKFINAKDYPDAPEGAHIMKKENTSIKAKLK